MAGETVLIVEDRRENIVHLANNVLKPGGYQVITAMDGQRGLKSILNDRPDLVIMDLNMPKMDGLEVLKALQEREIDTPVILTTFYGSEQVAEKALQSGAVDYVVKPYKIDDMLAAVERALANRSLPPPSPKEDRPIEETMPLTRQVERWMRDMNILTRVGKALVTHLDLERVYTRTIEAAIYITRADHAFLHLVREDDEAELCLCATRGPQDRQVRLLKQTVESELAVEVLLSGEAVFRPQAPSDTALLEIVGHPLGPIAGAPLRRQRKTIGVLVVARDPGEPAFSEADVEWLSGLADYAAIAVRNARTCQQRMQASSPPGSAAKIATLKDELDQLSADLQAVVERVQHLAAQLVEGDETTEKSAQGQ